MTDTSTVDPTTQPVDLAALTARANGKRGDPLAGMYAAYQREDAALAAKEKDPKIAADRAALSDATEKGARRVDDAYAGIEPIGDRVKPWDAQKELKDRSTNPLDAFGSFGAIFAAAASAFTHTPAINAMNGMAAAINGVKANDEASYKKGYEAWKENMNLALERHRAQHDDYEDAMELAKADVDGAKAKLLADSVKYDDAYTRAHLEMGDLASISSAMNARDSSARGWAAIQPELEAFHEHVDAVFATQKELLPKFLDSDQGKAFLAKNPGFDPNKPEDMKKLPREFIGAAALVTQQKEAAAKRAGETKAELYTEPAHKDVNGQDVPERTLQRVDGKFMTLDGVPVTPGNVSKLASASSGAGDVMPESTTQFWANVLKNGGSLPPGLSRTAAGSRMVSKIMSDIAGTSNPGDMIANVATVKANSTSLSNMTKMTDAATSFEATAAKNFDLALKLAPAAIPTDWGPWLNAWVEKGETAIGDKDVPPYVAALLTGANEYAKIMTGSTGAQGSTVDSRREAAEMFSPYLNKGQIEAVIAVAKQDMANRKASLYEQLDEIKQRLRGDASDVRGDASDQSHKIGDIVTSPDGVKHRITGFDKDGTPLGEVVK